MAHLLLCGHARLGELLGCKGYTGLHRLDERIYLHGLGLHVHS